MENIFGKSEKECIQIAEKFGESSFRGKQVFRFLYKNKVKELGGCHNLPREFLKKLAGEYHVFHGKVVMSQIDKEDGTKKYLIALEDNHCVETVLMKYEHGNTLCISTQVGCAMGCSFCASTKGGKIRNLSPGEMLGQVHLIEEVEKIRVSNVVMMGIGEPLDNYDNCISFIYLLNSAWEISQRKITLSTCGLVPQIRDLADLKLQINLALSFHTPFQKDRERLMPIAKVFDIKEIIKVCKYYYEKTGRRITLEYALIKGENDREEDLNEISAIHNEFPFHVNLISLNPISESVYKSSPNVNIFANELKRRGINCTIRRKIGRNIDAACGQLRQNVNFDFEVDE